MDVFTMVVAIVFVSCVAGAYNNYLKTRRVEAKAGNSEESSAEIDELRARNEELEKIEKDEKYQLDRELSRLERGG